MIKNRVKILGIVFSLAAYCLAVNTLTCLPVSANQSHRQTTGQDQFLATISTSHFSHTSQSESSGSIFNDSTVSDFNSAFDKLWALTQPREQVFEAKFIQYCIFSINFLIHYRKSDIIFPFHYFW